MKNKKLKEEIKRLMMKNDHVTFLSCQYNNGFLRVRSRTLRSKGFMFQRVMERSISATLSTVTRRCSSSRTASYQRGGAEGEQSLFHLIKLRSCFR